MVKTKLVPGVPKYLQESPSEALKKTIKSNSYRFVSDRALKGESFHSSTELIPDYLQVLAG